MASKILFFRSLSFFLKCILKIVIIPCPMNRLISVLWDIWCSVSIIGLWPRFIEPQLLRTTYIKIQQPDFLWIEGLKIVHFSDLHLPSKSAKKFLKRLTQKINSTNPDLIFFTGDFLTHSLLNNEELLENFLSSIKASIGIYASLGNHDYASYISRNNEGNYDVITNTDTHFITKSIKHLFSKRNKSPQITDRAKNCPPHPQLLSVINKTNVKLLHNETIQIDFKNHLINITGLGDYWAGKCDTKKAFENFKLEYPGLILSHNPDTIKFLKSTPGHIVFSGHTHGGQVNLPFVFKTFIGLENKIYKEGIFKVGNKTLFVTKGVGSHQKFRFFCPPEIAVITLC